MSDLVGNPEDRFSRVAAQIIVDSHMWSTNLKDPNRWFSYLVAQIDSV